MGRWWLWRHLRRQGAAFYIFAQGACMQAQAGRHAHHEKSHRRVQSVRPASPRTCPMHLLPRRHSVGPVTLDPCPGTSTCCRSGSQCAAGTAALTRLQQRAASAHCLDWACHEDCGTCKFCVTQSHLGKLIWCLCHQVRKAWSQPGILNSQAPYMTF